MNDSDSSWLSINALIIVSEIAIVLALIIVVVFVLSYRKRIKKKSLAGDFLEDIKNTEETRTQILKKKFEQATTLDQAEREVLVETLVNSEKKAYLHIAQLYVGYKPESLIELEEEIKKISENYIAIIEKVSKNSTDEEASSATSDDNNDPDNDSALRELKKQVTLLRDEKKTLKLKNAQLQTDFEASVDSIERMTTEFANMYEGGSADGEKRIKNEMYELRQILAKKMDATSVDGDFDAEIEAEVVPDMDITSDSASTDEETATK